MFVIDNIVQKNTLSFCNDQGILTLSAKQFDTGRKFIFDIVADDKPFDLTNCSVYLRILKPDKTEFQGHDCCSIVDNEIVIDTSVGNGEQILSCAGKNICELHLTDENNKTLTTWDFVIDVAKRVHNGEGIKSTDSWDALDKAKDEFNTDIYASNIIYNDTNSELESQNVQDALDELSDIKQDKIVKVFGQFTEATLVATNIPSCNGITYGNNKFVAVSDNGGVYYSEDGIIWNTAICSEKVTWKLNKIIYGNNKFVVVGANGIITFDKELENVEAIFDSGAFNDVAYGDNKFIVVGNRQPVYYSEDGINWLDTNYSNRVSLIDVIYGNGKFVIRHLSSIYHSEDLNIWNTINVSELSSSQGLTYGNGKFVATTDNGIYYSENLIDWTKTYTSEYTLNFAVFNNNKFVVGGQNGTLLYSIDGLTWMKINNAVITPLGDGIFANNKIISIGVNSIISVDYIKENRPVEDALNELNDILHTHIFNQNNPHEIKISQLGMTKNDVTTALGYTPYTPTEIDNKLSMLESGLDWKETVTTYEELITTYTNPEKGWTVNVGDENGMTTYRYNGSEWVDIGVITDGTKIFVDDYSIMPAENVMGASVDDIIIDTFSGNVHVVTNDGKMAGNIFEYEEIGNIKKTSGGVTGVKGNAETSYRTGQVNLTPANIGAIAVGDRLKVFTITSNNTISKEIADLGITLNNTFDELHEALKQNNQKFENDFLIITDANSSVFNKSLPITPCIIRCTALKYSANRHTFTLYSVTNNDVYINMTNAGVLNGWVKISRSDEHNIRTYSSFEQLGTTLADCKSLIGLVPQSAEFIFTFNSNMTKTAFDNGLIPINAVGVLNVVNANARGYARFTTDNKEMYFGISSNANTTDFIWTKVATENEINPFVEASTHSDYNNNQHLLVTKNFMSYWNGAYNANNKSNLAYCNKGAFGDMATKSSSDYIPKSGGAVTGDLQFDNKGIYWRESGYGDKFKIVPEFSGTDDSNKLLIQSAVGAANTDPEMTTKISIAGKTGDTTFVGNVNAPKYLINNTDINNIFAKASENRIKTYYDPSQFGKSWNDITAWPGTLPAQSKLIFAVYEAIRQSLYDKGLIPINNTGVLEVVNVGRGFARFTTDNQVWISHSHGINTAGSAMSAWCKLATATDISTLQSNFQAGVDTIYNACVSVGSTPSDKTPTGIQSALNTLKTGYGNWYGIMRFINEVGFGSNILYASDYTFESGNIMVLKKGESVNLTILPTIDIEKFAYYGTTSDSTYKYKAYVGVPIAQGVYSWGNQYSGYGFGHNQGVILNVSINWPATNKFIYKVDALNYGIEIFTACHKRKDNAAWISTYFVVIVV